VSSGSDARFSQTRGSYLGATADDLRARSLGGRVRALLDPRALFPRHGGIVLFANRLVLTGWDDGAEVTVHASEIAAISGRGDPTHDRLLAGALRRRAVRPVVVRHNNGEALYLLINYHGFPARNDNVFWVELLTDLLTGKGNS
jgi:hypothetical protein